MTVTRRATVGDARAIAELQLRAWYWNYQDLVSAQHFMEWDEDSRTERWTEILALEQTTGATQTFVADIAGAVRGFATVGPSREAGAPGDEGELRALYVDPPAQGAGVGTALLTEAEQALRAVGATVSVLRTLSGNGLARLMYERRGYALVDGGEAPHPWGTTDVLYRREL